jgi:predicted nicotinamide N-methyase
MAERAGVTVRADPAAFIRTHARLQPVGHAPELRLHLADDTSPLWRLGESELAALGVVDPYWAFAWAGGQALARHLLDHPALVAGRRVLDFATGSGIAAIAAARAGASEVTAVDIDPLAIAALGLNAAANAVAVEGICADVIGQDAGWDVILAGDVCYERALAERVIAWADRLGRRGARVLIGDPGRAWLPRDRLERLAEYQVPVARELEDMEVRRTAVWQLRPGATAG